MKSRSASSTDDRLANAGHTAETGRFAPSPTGPLHLGSLLTAVASYVHARALGGRWLVRMEDLDTPRCVPGAADAILQHARPARSALGRTDLPARSNRVLSRRARAASLAAGTPLRARAAGARCRKAASIPGTCRQRVVPPDAPPFDSSKGARRNVEFIDEVQGRYAQRLRTDVGDFVVSRRDGIVAYQLAVVVDDAAQRITHVVRGADLLDNTPRQLLLFRLLGAPAPRYAHVPVLVDRSGQKLSKQTGATAVDVGSPSDNLRLDPQLARPRAPNRS